jgi:2-polyprenyl-6-hydroxyphenyl methylase/3-demethylubiquinone-9 3-methyltransferase
LDSKEGINETLLHLLREEPLEGLRLLDVGCGTGTLTFVLAPFVRSIVGIDRSREAVQEARRKAEEEGVGGKVEFHVADAYTVDYRRFGPIDLVVAHLFMAEEVVERASQALSLGAPFAFVCLHAENLKEFGMRSRFSYTREGLRRILERYGFRVEHLEIEKEMESFRSPEEILERFSRARDAWEKSGRWQGLLRYLEGGGRSVTHSLLVGKARKGGGLI